MVFAIAALALGFWSKKTIPYSMRPAKGTIVRKSGERWSFSATTSGLRIMRVTTMRRMASYQRLSR